MGSRILFLGLILLQAAAAQQAPLRRLGIVISNSSYAKLKPATQANAEAKLIEDALKAAQFSVSPFSNLSQSGLLKVDGELTTTVKPGDQVFVYFSGYAVQGEDDNYLLPVDFDPKGEGPLEDRAYHLSRLAQRLQRIGAGLIVIVVEGCRPIDGVLAGVSAPGLSEPDLSYSKETLYAFAASTGQTSVDKGDQPAAFTTALAKWIRTPGSQLQNVFNQAKADVNMASSGRQIPHVLDNIGSNLGFYFIAPLPKVIEAPKVEVIHDTTEIIKTEKEKFVPHQNSRDREEYVFLPSGEFLMGCVPRDELCEKDETPQHKVKITKSFWLGVNEVQVISYNRYVDAQKAKMPPAPLWNGKWKITNTPIANVTVEDAHGYCQWAGGRLPTEAEWEYAARSGMDNQINPVTNGGDPREKANFEGKKGNDRFDQTAAPVRSFDASPWNLFDMAGNVWEMVNDFYSSTYYSEPTAGVDPLGPAASKETVKRGGSFDSDAKKHLRISIRKPFSKSDNATGFRCVLEDTDQTHQLLKIQ